MRKNHRANRAILVLECPWGLDDSDANRSSVIPFIEGVGKYAGDTEVYHANFYDKSSFKKALNHLCKSSFDNAIVYIAAHGLKNKVAGIDIVELMCEIGERSKSQNITGLVLGCCFVGKEEFAMQVCIQGTNMKWCTGYTSACNWLDSTLIDCAILAQMLEFDKDDFSSWDSITEGLASAISPFAGNTVIGSDTKDRPVSLKQSLQVVAQPNGQGNRAKTITSEVWEAVKGYQM